MRIVRLKAISKVNWTIALMPLLVLIMKNAQKSLLQCEQTSHTVASSLYLFTIHIFSIKSIFCSSTNFNVWCIVDAHLNPLLISHSSHLSLLMIVYQMAFHFLDVIEKVLMLALFCSFQGIFGRINLNFYLIFTKIGAL